MVRPITFLFEEEEAPPFQMLCLWALSRWTCEINPVNLFHQVSLYHSDQVFSIISSHFSTIRYISYTIHIKMYKMCKNGTARSEKQPVNPNLS